jgi:1,4-dihydroxy-6-naphthoate synthase
MRRVSRLLRESIQYGLAHRADALAHAMQYGRDLDTSLADRFVGMYVNHWTLDYGEPGRQAVRLLLRRGHERGILPSQIEPEFVE